MGSKKTTKSGYLISCVGEREKVISLRPCPDGYEKKERKNQLVIRNEPLVVISGFS